MSAAEAGQSTAQHPLHSSAEGRDPVADLAENVAKKVDLKDGAAPPAKEKPQKQPKEKKAKAGAAVSDAPLEVSICIALILLLQH
jgi:hypothetical protein